MTLQELLRADDMILVAHLEEKLQNNLFIYQTGLKKINAEIMASENTKYKISLNEKLLEQLIHLNYLGIIIEKNGK